MLADIGSFKSVNNYSKTTVNPVNYPGTKRCHNCDYKQLCSEFAIQMEHSYSRDHRPIEGANGLTTRTLMVHKPPQCPSCHSHTSDEGIEMDEGNHPPIPSYNEAAAKESMNECSRIANSVRNLNSDDQDWEEKVNKNLFTYVQEKLFSRIVRILDLDHLARLATIGKQHEPVQRRVIIDKSVQRMRQALASVSWDPKLTQWLHGLLMDSLPPSYMACYLDILQTLKTRLPSLMDKMLFGKPMNINQDLLTPVMKKQWEPIVAQKTRKLPSNAVIVIIPSTVSTTIPPRMQKWYQLLSTVAPIVQVSIPGGGNALSKQPIDQAMESLVSISRVKIQDLRAEQPSRHIILVGFNAGAALALQIALVENINSVVCLGFSYNTINGARGAPDDHIQDIKAPIMFVIGQNSSRSSQEEIEYLRERLQSESSLVVVGSADDVLRVPKNKRQIEGITQSMVDNMVTDEIYEFIKNCIVNPPGPRTPTFNIGSTLSHSNLQQVRRIGSSGIQLTTNTLVGRKRKISQDDSENTPTKIKLGANKQGSLKIPKKPKIQDPFKIKRKVGRPRTRPLPTSSGKSSLLTQPSTEVLNMAIQSILPDTETGNISAKVDDAEGENQILSTFEIVAPSQKLDIRSATQGVMNQTISTSGGNSSPMIIPISNQRNPTNVTGVQKVKMIPPGQFVQLKGPVQSTPQKIFTIKSSPMISGQTVSGSGATNEPPKNQSQVFTFKTTPTSFIQAANASQNPVTLSSQKFTVLKPATTNIIGNSGGDTTIKTITAADLSSTNIFDMPIVFADNDGNLHETAPIPSTNISSSASTTTSSPQQIILTPQSSSQDQSNKGGYIFNTSGTKPKTNKVVFINRNTMKPCPNIISKTVPPLKYTKVVVTNPKTSTPSLVTRATGIIEPETKNISTVAIQKAKPIEFAPTTIVKTSSGTFQQIQSSVSGQGVSGILNTSTAGIGGGISKQFQPIIINVDSDKTTFKNMVKVGNVTSAGGGIEHQIKPTILLKSSGLKHIPVLKPGILNRNLTVRKLNLLPTMKSNASGGLVTSVNVTQLTPISVTSSATSISSTTVIGATNNVISSNTNSNNSDSGNSLSQQIISTSNNDCNNG